MSLGSFLERDKNAMKKISDFNISGKRILLRVDINSPVSGGMIEDSPRFKEAAKTINNILSKGAKLAIIAHQGRKGDRDFTSLERHALLLSKHSGKKIKYVGYLFEENATDAIKQLENGEGILLKNVRAYDDEMNVGKKGNRYKELCDRFDIYVNDAFSVSHRKQGSIILPPRYLPSCMGICMEKELEALRKIKDSKKGTAYLIGGTKVDDYLPIFNNLSNKKSCVLASGVLANLLLAARGVNLGYEREWLNKKGYSKLIPRLKEICKKYGKQIVLPVDLAISTNGKRQDISLQEFPKKDKILDVGMETVDLYKSNLSSARSIFMKGPLGFTEEEQFSRASVEILREVSALTRKKKAFSLLGGGHLTTVADKNRVPNNFSYVSMSGGALIAYISGQKLPGIEALKGK